MLESKSMLFSLAGSGQSSSSCYHTVYQNQFLPGKAVPSVRYLGARIQYVGKILMRWVHAFMLQNGSGTNGPFLIQVCIVQAWEGVVLHCTCAFCSFVRPWNFCPGTRQIQATQYIDSPTRSQAHAGQRVLQASSGSWQHQNYSLQVKNCLDMVGAFVLVSLGCRLDGFLGTSSLQEII